MLTEVKADIHNSVDVVFDFKGYLSSQNSLAYGFRTAIEQTATSFKALITNTTHNSFDSSRLIYNATELVTNLLENSIWRGFHESPNPVLIEYFLGKNGLVIQVTDNGCGFDPQPIIEATQNGTRIKGIHY